jgi:uncharacterized protein (DUF983 family)
MPEKGYYPRRSVLSTALACKCPRCGEGALFAGYLTVAETCAVCGFDLSKQDSGDGPAVFIIFILGFIVVPLALLVEAKFEPPMWVHVAIWPLVIVAGALALLRPMKAAMIALQFKHKASEGGRVDYD